MYHIHIMGFGMAKLNSTTPFLAVPVASSGLPIIMVKCHLPKGHSCPPGPPHAWQCRFQAWLVRAAVLAFLCIAPACATAAGTSVTVNPVNGTDSPACNVSAPCKTIAYAVQSIGASFVSLSSGPFNESTVNISNIASLVISGVPSGTVFECSSRLVPTGAAFSIVNSTVTITGVTFQSCYNPTSNGGAMSASDSSVVVSQCSFINCSAASGGAMSVTGSSGDLFLDVQDSNFTANSANGGGLASCPADPTQPCSTWGGAIAAFEMSNVAIGGCTMTGNSAHASVPTLSQQFNASRNAVAGGGCVSVLFSGNSSGSNVKFSGSTFLSCTVTVGTNVIVGNGTRCCCA
jgi:hypothetical protein